jgi:hypothetical protein
VVVEERKALTTQRVGRQETGYVKKRVAREVVGSGHTGRGDMGKGMRGRRCGRGDARKGMLKDRMH